MTQIRRIRLVDLGAQYERIGREIREAIGRVIQKGAFILGDEVQAFEEEFAAYCGARFAVGCASGTAALVLALQACNVSHGEVLTVPNTFIATTEAITLVGAKPRFVDVNETDSLVQIDGLRAAVRDDVRAIVPVHLYGFPAPMQEILEIAQKHDSVVIEDAAQAHGALIGGRCVGTFGDAGCFSFFPAKNLGAYGDAGAVVTNDEVIARNVRLLRNHGRERKYVHEREGNNLRMDALQAAILRVKLKHLDAWNEARRQHAALYSDLLADLPVTRPTCPENVTPVYHLYVIHTEKRNELAAFLKDRGIETGIHYPIPLHLQPAYAYLNYAEGAFPITEKLARTALSLPMYPELTDEQIRFVCESIRAFFDA